MILVKQLVIKVFLRLIGKTRRLICLQKKKNTLTRLDGERYVEFDVTGRVAVHGSHFQSIQVGIHRQLGAQHAWT